MAVYSPPICPNGSTLTFGTSAFTVVLRRFGWSGYTRESIDTRMFNDAVIAGTTYRAVTKKAGKYVDFGRITATIRFNPDDAPPMDQDAETLTLTFTADGVTTAGKWAASGFMTEFSIVEQAVETASIMEATITCELSGEVTFTDST